MLTLALVDQDTGATVPISAAGLRVLGFVSAVERDFYRAMLVELRELLFKPASLPPEVAAIFEVFDYDVGATPDSGPAEADLREQSEWIFARFGVFAGPRGL